MKRTPTILLSILFLGMSLVCYKSGFSGISVKNSARSAYPSVHLLLSPTSVLHSPLSLVFPFESFNHPVCRRPTFLFWESNSLTQYYFRQSELNMPSATTGFMRINQDITFQSGNSYLLIPQTITLRLNDNLQPIPKPTLNIHRPD